MLDLYTLKLAQLWRDLKFRWHRFRQIPVVSVQHFGQLTSRPQVVVSVSGMFAQGNGWGSQSVYTWLVSENGDALATYHAKGLAQIIGAHYVDERLSPDGGF